jgi:hypothetical protein
VSKAAVGSRQRIRSGSPYEPRMYLTDPQDWEAVGRAHAAVFGVHPPAATMVVVAGLLDPRWRVEIEAEAELSWGDGTRPSGAH